jgi:hypothetical protein
VRALASKSRTWNLPASAALANHPSGSLPFSTRITANAPTTYQSIWIASTHTTARTPPRKL